jgi:hypothetical protein
MLHHQNRWNIGSHGNTVMFDAGASVLVLRKPSEGRTYQTLSWAGLMDFLYQRE